MNFVVADNNVYVSDSAHAGTVHDYCVGAALAMHVDGAHRHTSYVTDLDDPALPPGKVFRVRIEFVDPQSPR